MSVVVSVRISNEVKRILEEAGISIRVEVKRFLENLAWKIKMRKNLRVMDEILKNMPPASKGFSAKSVREDRERS